MPIFVIIALDIVITLRFSINCSTIICLPTVCFLWREKPLVRPMAPSLFSIIYFQIYKPKNPKIPRWVLFTLRFRNLLYLSLSDLTFASDREGIDNPFIAWVQVFDCLCRYWWFVRSSPTGLIPWFLTEGNTYLYFAASPFPIQGKKQRKRKK